MSKNEPVVMKDYSPYGVNHQPCCIFCGKPIQAGELVHFARSRGFKWVHVPCYEKEAKA